jgi:hypothetical protein
MSVFDSELHAAKLEERVLRALELPPVAEALWRLGGPLPRKGRRALIVDRQDSCVRVALAAYRGLHRFGSRWRVVGFVGRYPVPSSGPREAVPPWVVAVGRRLGLMVGCFDEVTTGWTAKEYDAGRSRPVVRAPALLRKPGAVVVARSFL